MKGSLLPSSWSAGLAELGGFLILAAQDGDHGGNEQNHAEPDHHEAALTVLEPDGRIAEQRNDPHHAVCRSATQGGHGRVSHRVGVPPGGDGGRRAAHGQVHDAVDGQWVTLVRRTEDDNVAHMQIADGHSLGDDEISGLQTRAHAP